MEVLSCSVVFCTFCVYATNWNWLLVSLILAIPCKVGRPDSPAGVAPSAGGQDARSLGFVSESVGNFSKAGEIVAVESAFPTAFLWLSLRISFLILELSAASGDRCRSKSSNLGFTAGALGAPAGGSSNRMAGSSCGTDTVFASCITSPSCWTGLPCLWARMAAAWPAAKPAHCCCGIERLGNRSSEVSVGGLELQALNSKRRVASACCTAFVVQSCTVLCRRVIEECLFHLPRWQRQQPQREHLVPKQAGTHWRCCGAWWGMVIAWRFECFDFQCLSQTKKCICGPM